jgi:hypothetical protein
VNGVSWEGEEEEEKAGGGGGYVVESREERMRTHLTQRLKAAGNMLYTRKERLYDV